MKTIMITALLALSSINAFASDSFTFNVTEVECSGVPQWIQFNINQTDTQGNYTGKGIENYLDFDFKCKMSPAKDKLTCSSAQGVSAQISIDANNIVSAIFKGHYHGVVKIGCIARM